MYTLSVLEHQLKNALKKFNKATGNEIKINLYNFVKHSWQTHMISKGASLEALKEWHGHSTMEMVLVYTYVEAREEIQMVNNKQNVVDISKAHH
jgi:site-specific recombinase XerD